MTEDATFFEGEASVVTGESDCQDVAIDTTPELAEDAADFGSEESPLVAVVRLTGDGAGHDDKLRWGRGAHPSLNPSEGGCARFEKT